MQAALTSHGCTEAEGPEAIGDSQGKASKLAEHRKQALDGRHHLTPARA